MIKHVRFALLAAAIVVLLVGQASAALLVYESFSYTAGENLGGTDPDGADETSRDESPNRVLRHIETLRHRVDRIQLRA